MKRTSAVLFAGLVLTLMMVSLACTPTFRPPTITPPPPPPPPTSVPTPIPTPGCASYSDSFGNVGTLANYDYFDAGTQASGTSTSSGYGISSGVFQDTNTGGLAIVKDSLFSHSLSDYTVEGDFEMDSYQGSLGVFGIAFRTGSNGSFYCFQWNGNFSNADGGTKNWELEKNTGNPSVSFSYPSCCVTTPGYTLGTWVHLKVVAAGNNFKCYVNFNDGVGDHLIFNVTDSSSPYTSGGVGVRTYGINSPNVARIDNFFVNAQSCVTTACTGTTYSDNFASNTMANFDVTDGYWTASTASAQGEQITSGEFQVAPSSVVYPYNIVKDSVFSRALGDYRVEGDFKLDTVSQGVFGLIVRATPASAYGYIFQWNGLNSRWELEKQKGPAIYDYPGANTASPYVLGTWVHLKIVASGSTFTCSIDTGSGPQVIFNAITDTYPTPAPYTAGGVGIRAYSIDGGNILHVDNFLATTCP